jgi:hypothetical protein
MEFLTYLTTISESPNTIMFCTFISTAFFSPCRSASYSAMLFVHSNFNLQAIKVLLPVGSMSTHPAPTPSLDLDPLK